MGFHSLSWQYNVFGNDIPLYIEIISITIEGTEEDIYSCQPCVGNNPLCNECPEDSFKNENVFIINIGYL
jgi:hypothetical protein